MQNELSTAIDNGIPTSELWCAVYVSRKKWLPSQKRASKIYQLPYEIVGR